MVQHFTDAQIGHGIELLRKLQWRRSWLRIITVQLHNEKRVFPLSSSIARPEIKLIDRKGAASTVNYLVTRCGRSFCFGQVEGEFAGQSIVAGNDKNGLAFGQQFAAGVVSKLRDSSPASGPMQGVLVDR